MMGHARTIFGGLKNHKISGLQLQEFPIYKVWSVDQESIFLNSSLGDTGTCSLIEHQCAKGHESDLEVSPRLHGEDNQMPLPGM